MATIRFAGDRIGLVESGRAKPGGIDDCAEIVGSSGVTYADVLRGSSLLACLSRPATVEATG